MVIAVDFDGTIVQHRYPQIGEEISFATETLKMLIQDHHKLILWTVREGKLLHDAVEWRKEHGVEFYAVNKNHPMEEFTDINYSRKLRAHLFIDDYSLGGIPDWEIIYKKISKGQAFTADYPKEKLRRKKRMVQKVIPKRLKIEDGIYLLSTKYKFHPEN